MLRAVLHISAVDLHAACTALSAFAGCRCAQFTHQLHVTNLLLHTCHPHNTSQAAMTLPRSPSWSKRSRRWRQQAYDSGKPTAEIQALDTVLKRKAADLERLRPSQGVCCFNIVMYHHSSCSRECPISDILDVKQSVAGIFSVVAQHNAAAAVHYQQQLQLLNHHVHWMRPRAYMTLTCHSTAPPALSSSILHGLLRLLMGHVLCC
jgi:hypothetical protein